jgi:ABC-2 type transport system ATP-binding protein
MARLKEIGYISGVTPIHWQVNSHIMSPIITATNLVKQYPGVMAVDGIDLSIPKGICFGLLGPNGAGKTTTIEMLEGIHLPTSGTVLYKGEPLGTRYREEVGIQFQHTALQEFLTVRETLELFERLYQKTMPIPELIELCSLADILERDTRKISGGQRQRLLLALALINDPDLIFLDEPTTGLDPQARRNFWDLVKLVKSRAKTIVLTTHYMEEAYALCDEIAIMDKGRIVSQGTPAQLLSEHFGDVVLQIPSADAGGRLSDLGLNAVQAGDLLEIRTNRLHHTLQQLIENGVNLDRLRIRAWTLEDLFINVTTGKKLSP